MKLSVTTSLLGLIMTFHTASAQFCESPPSDCNFEAVSTLDTLLISLYFSIIANAALVYSAH